MKTFLSLTLVTILSTPMLAGVIITTEEVKGAPNAPAVKGEVLINGNLLTLKNENKGQPETIYRGDRGVIWVIMHSSKKYREIDKRSFEMQAANFQRQQAQMKAQMKNMPEEQKRLMEQAMQGMQGASSPPPKVSVKKTNETQKIDDITCTLWTAYASGKKISDIWVASYEDCGISSSDVKAIGQMSDYINTLDILASRTPAGRQPVSNPLAHVSMTNGFPKKITRYDDGKFISEFRVKTVEATPVETTKFFVPRGYSL